MRLSSLHAFLQRLQLQALLYGRTTTHDVPILSTGELLKGDVRMPRKHWGHICMDAKQLVRGMLAPNPAKRLTLEEVLDSPFLSGQASKTPIEGLPAQLENVSWHILVC